MKVRYNPVVGGLLLALGLASLVLGGWLWALGDFTPGVVVGVLVTTMGMLTLLRPYFWVHPNKVTVLALLGPARREFPYKSVDYDGRRLFTVDADGERRRVPVARWIANSADWAAATDPDRRSVD